MKEARIKILELLKDGHIDAKMAETMLDALDDEKKLETTEVVNKQSFKTLKILINDEKGENVNISIPLEFAKLLKTGNFKTDLSNNDIDIDKIIQLANSGIVGDIVNIKTSEGKTVVIKVE